MSTRLRTLFAGFAFLSVLLALSLSLVETAYGATSAPPNEHVDAAYQFASREWAVPYSDLRKVGNCESSHNPNARGGGGSYLGLFQHSSRYWKSRVANFNAYVDRHNSREPNKLEHMSGTWNAPIDNARMTAWMVRTQTGWRPWSCRP